MFSSLSARATVGGTPTSSNHEQFVKVQDCFDFCLSSDAFMNIDGGGLRGHWFETM